MASFIPDTTTMSPTNYLLTIHIGEFDETYSTIIEPIKTLSQVFPTKEDAYLSLKITMCRVLLNILLPDVQEVQAKRQERQRAIEDEGYISSDDDEDAEMVSIKVIVNEIYKTMQSANDEYISQYSACYPSDLVGESMSLIVKITPVEVGNVVTVDAQEYENWSDEIIDLIDTDVNFAMETCLDLKIDF